MTDHRPFRLPLGRRAILQGGAALAACTAFGGTGARAQTPGGKVIIGAFADGGLTPFKSKIIPLAKSEAGFDVEFLEDEYGVTLEKWFADAQSGAGQYDIYLLDDPWVPQFGAAEVLEDLGAGGIDVHGPRAPVHLQREDAHVPEYTSPCIPRSRPLTSAVRGENDGKP